MNIKQTLLRLDGSDVSDLYYIFLQSDDFYWLADNLSSNEFEVLSRWVEVELIPYGVSLESQLNSHQLYGD